MSALWKCDETCRFRIPLFNSDGLTPTGNRLMMLDFRSTEPYYKRPTPMQ